MADDLDAFLRQAAARRAERKKPSPAQPAPSKRQPALPQQPVQRRTAVDPAEVQVVEAVVVPVPPDRLESNVDTSRFGRRADQLGEEVELADEHVAERLHDTFDHRLGSLKVDGGLNAPAEQGAVELSLRQEIAAILADPQAVRKAIILSDILSSPEHRW